MAKDDFNPKKPHDIDAATEAHAASGIAVAKEKQSLWKRPALWLLLLCAALVIVVMGSMHSNATASKAVKSNTYYNSDDSWELDANLAKLAHENTNNPKEASQAQSSPAPRWHFTNAVNPTSTSKQQQYRMNAPLIAYSDNAPSLANNAATDTTSGKTFIDDNAYTRLVNANAQTTAVMATRIAHPNTTIASGELIHAVLETAIDSDLPGMVRAIVSRPAYAYTGERPLIPAGTRLIGQYASATLEGINRVMVVWNRLILPNGIAVQLNSPSTDALGQGGIGADAVNHHFFLKFGTASLLSLIGAGASTFGVNPDDEYNSSASYRMAMAESFQQSAQSSLQGAQSIKPTLHVYQGAQINVFVAHDLDFYAVLHAGKADVS